MNKNSAKLKVALICGGPSLERGISLNSARSVMDHLSSDNIEIIPFYFDSQKKAYKISTPQLYSNTPSDFDFKLKQTATSLSKKRLVELLKEADIVFPVMHGKFGEDGEIQKFLEKNNLPFVGSNSESCKIAFDKFSANEFIKENGFFTLPSVVLKIYHTDHKQILEKFFKENKVKRAVVKPASGGSSIGVFSVSTPQEALEKSKLLFSKRMDTRVVVEPFCEGKEFTIIINENKFGLPVAFPPTEIETDYKEHQIFDFRKKYLPTRQVTWHCPPRFDQMTIEKIQAQAEQLFALFKMRDFGRFDGWVLPNGSIWFCDFNPVSGMEQNSFLFQQASRIGMTHSDILKNIVKNSCMRYGIKFPENEFRNSDKRKSVNILMGGDNSEKQVSLMSGTNVWLKLRHSKKYKPDPYLLDTKGNVWHLPYHLCLNHTVEEIEQNCRNYPKDKKKLESFEDRARLHLGLTEEKNKEEFFEPKKLSLDEFINKSKFVFIALHGGDGENGVLQRKLSDKKVLYNGPDSAVSAICIDKWKTSRLVNKLEVEDVSSIPGKIVDTKFLFDFNETKIKSFWKSMRAELDGETLIVKPVADGCTTGIVHLYSSNDLKKYIELLEKKSKHVPKDTFNGQKEVIEMPSKVPQQILFERFIETDILRVKANKLNYKRKSGWVEITVGVLEKNGKLKSLNPSITIAEGEVLTVEEKFQGGTGVNITPPPEKIIKPHILNKVKRSIVKLANKIGVKGYSRIDAFVNIKSGELMMIEVNTLPGLTPSTVFYHQGLSENLPIFPDKLLEHLVSSKVY